MISAPVVRKTYYSGGRELVKARFETVDGEAEWIVAESHMRSGSKKSGNMVPCKAPGNNKCSRSYN